MMAHSQKRRKCIKGVTRIVLVVVGLLLVGFSVGTSLYWCLKKAPTDQASCYCGVCDCFVELGLSLPPNFINETFADCGKHNPELKEEMEKDSIDLVGEELRLTKIVANETSEHSRTLIREAKKVSSRYQREAEKCNAGMDTCEEARERAEKLLIEERKLSALWEKRAREHGWIEDDKVYT